MEEVLIWPKEMLLKLCSPQMLINIEEAYSLKDVQCEKIGEGTFGEVYRLKKSDCEKDTILKVMPIGGGLLPHKVRQRNCDEVYPEVVMSKMLNELKNSEYNKASNFPSFICAKCIVGPMPREIIQAWVIYNERIGSRKFHNPDSYKATQIYLILEFLDAGIPLAKFPLKDPIEAVAVLKQVACALCIAEQCFCFEHRDLHAYNILISHTSEKYIHYVLNGKEFALESHGMIVTIIDFSISRITDTQGEVVYTDLNYLPSKLKDSPDSKMGVYVMMKKNAKKDWSRFQPNSNLLWIKYLLKYLMKNKFSNDSDVPDKSLTILKSLEEDLHCDTLREVIHNFQVL